MTNVPNVGRLHLMQSRWNKKLAIDVNDKSFEKPVGSPTAKLENRISSICEKQRRVKNE